MTVMERKRSGSQKGKQQEKGKEEKPGKLSRLKGFGWHFIKVTIHLGDTIHCE